MLTPENRAVIDRVFHELELLGYRRERITRDDGIVEERLIRPDGTVAIIARVPKES
jgi:hypothetical protein